MKYIKEYNSFFDGYFDNPVPDDSRLVDTISDSLIDIFDNYNIPFSESAIFNSTDNTYETYWTWVYLDHGKKKRGIKIIDIRKYGGKYEVSNLLDDIKKMKSTIEGRVGKEVHIQYWNHPTLADIEIYLY